jgi:putative flippase GtrA
MPQVRQVPEKNIPDCAGFLFGFKARRQAHSELCNGRRNAEAEQKDKQGGTFFDRNRPSLPDGRRRSSFSLLLQYARFGVVGLSATIVHSVLYLLLAGSLGISPFIANLLAFSVAVLVSYFGHFQWTFRNENGAGTATDMVVTTKLARFVVVAVIGLVLNSLAVYSVVDVMGLAYGYALIPMVGLVPIVVFVLSKLWVFRLVGTESWNRSNPRNPGLLSEQPLSPAIRREGRLLLP